MFGMECWSLWLPKQLRRLMGLSLGCETECVAFLCVCVSPCGMVSGKKTVSLVQSSESFMWYCQFLIYSGKRMRNLFWLSSNGFQPRTLLVNHLLFLGKGICLERVYITPLQEIFSLSHITRGYLAARYCGWRRRLLVGRPLREFWVLQNVLMKLLKTWKDVVRCNNRKLSSAIYI